MRKLFLRSDRNSGHLGDQSGFTLLEVMIAITIMVLSMASIFQISSTSIGAIEKVKNFNSIARLARNVMQETEYEIEGKAFGDIEKEKDGTFENPFQDFRWHREVKEVEFPNLGVAAPKEGGGEGNDAMSMIGQNVSKFLSQSIREITVTIFWKRAEGELKYSITTYWVDLNHEFTITQ